MALNRKEVFKQNTFEEQRLKINEIGQDLFDISTGVTPIDRLLVDGSIVPGTITDSEGKTGEPGQVLKATENGILWKTLSIENVLYVSKDGNDENDGLSTETAKASIGSALRSVYKGYLGKLQDGANQILLNKKFLQDETIGTLLSEFKDYAIGGKQQDAYDDIIANKQFIAQEAVARMLANNPGFTIPNGNQNCIDDVLIFVENVAFNVKYGGNQKVYDAAKYYINFPSTIEGERDRSVETYREAAYLMMAVMRHDPTLASEIVGTHGLTPVYKSGVILDNLGFSSQRALDAANSISDNKNLIAYEAYARMEAELSWIPPVGTTAQDCIDDILLIIDQVIYDLTYGGNSKVYDAGLVYIQNNYIDDGQRDAAVNAWIKAQYIIFDVVRQRDISDEIVGTHGYTQSINPNLILDPLEAVSQLHLDAYRLIDINKQFIAAEAYDLMLQQFPGFTPTLGTVSDCLDDVYDVIDAVQYNLIYGGNDKVYDAADIYVNDPSLANEDREEAAAVFDKVKDLCIDVMRNVQIVPVGGPINTFTQYIDPNIIVDTANPTCQDVATSLGTLFNIIIDAVWDGVGNAAGTITAIRTEPTPATVFGGGCSDVNFTIANLFTILIQAIGTDAGGVGNLTGIVRTTPPAQTQYGAGCVDVANAIYSLAQIYFQVIGNDIDGVGNLDGITRTLSQRFVFPDSPAESGRYKDARNLIYLNMEEIQDRALAEIALEHPDFNFIFNDDPDVQRFYDAYNLIQANKAEIQDRALAQIAVEYNEALWGTDWIIPGDTDPGRGVFYDAYRLIQLNRQEIIDGAYLASGGSIPSDPGGVKCKRDIGYFVDAISLDVFLGGNIYARKFTQQYFGSNGLLNSLLAGEVPQSILAFEQARDLMIDAMQNGLTITDPTVTANLPLCAPVESAITTLSAIVVDNLTSGNSGGTINLPPIVGRALETGGSKCRRDIGYFVDAISKDLQWQTNKHSLIFIDQYFTGGVFNSFLSGETVQSNVAFNKARDMMILAITNQLYVKDLTLTPDPDTDDNQSLASCADVQTAITTSTAVITQIIDEESLANLPPLDLGNYPGDRFSRYKDSYRLIQQNKQEIIDRAFGELAIQYNEAQWGTDWVVPNDPDSSPIYRYFDSYRLIQQNRQNIIDLAWDNMVIAFPGVASTETICKRDIGFFVDYISLDIVLGGTIKYCRKFVRQYFDEDGVWNDLLEGEELASIYAFENARELMKAAITNATSITLNSVLYDITSWTKDLTLTVDPGLCANVQTTLDTLTTVVTDVITAKDFSVAPPELNIPKGRYQDASNLIFENKNEIADRALAEIAIQHPFFVFPSDEEASVANRHYDAYRLIQENKIFIVADAWGETVTQYPSIASTETKCQRDLGYLIDAISLDVFTRGNRYSREFVLQYFDANGNPNTDVSTPAQKEASIYAFEKARDLIISSLTNQYVVTDTNVLLGPSIFNSGEANQPYGANACADVQSTVANLITIITDVIQNDDIDLLPYVNNGSFNTGINKCKRDIGYLIDGVIKDLFVEGNVNSKEVALGYFDQTGTFLYLEGEGAETITAFTKAAEVMKLAINNQLYKKDLTLPDSGDDLNPEYTDLDCANVRTTITDLVNITTGAITAELATPGTGKATVDVIPDNFGIPAAGQSKCKRDIGYFVDAISLDIFLGAGNKYSRKFVQSYFSTNAVPLYPGLIGEESQSVIAFNAARDMMQKAITNQLIEKDRTISIGKAEYDGAGNYILLQESGNPASCVDVQSSIATLTTTITDQLIAGNLNSLPAEISYEFDRYDDAANLIGLNKVEIQDRSVAEIAIQYPDFFFPGDDQSTDNSRFYDSYRLIQLNRQEIVDTAYDNLTNLLGLPVPAPNDLENKCKRDIGYFVDAISLDVFLQGNRYSREFAKQYFDATGALTPALQGEITQSIFAFQQARNLMKAAITNQLTVKDLTLTPDPITKSNTASNSCSNVQTTINNLTSIVTTVLGDQNLNSLSSISVDPGIYQRANSSETPGGKKCHRDIGFFIEGIIYDLKNRSNTGIIDYVKEYFVNGSFVYINNETDETITALEKAAELMKLAITNQLYKKNFDIIADPATNSNNDPNSCADVQSTIDNLTVIATDVLADGNLTSLDAVVVNKGTPPLTELKCRRDIGFVTRSIAEDLYAGGNINCINAVRAYFDNNGAPISNGLVNEEAPSITAFNAAAKYAKKAITNQLYGKDFGLFEGPEEYGLSFAPVPYTTSGNDKVCVDVQRTIDSLALLMTTVIADQNLSSLDNITENRGRKGWKITESLCYRDSGYIIDAIATDLKVGGNVNITDVGNFYFDNKTGELIYINGELEQSLLAYRAAAELMKLAANNFKTGPSNELYIPKYSFEDPYINPELIIDYEYPYCADVAESIDNYFNILEFMLFNGKNSVPVQLPSFKTTIFIKSGVYNEQNPIVLPPSTGLFGDNLRDVSIYPVNPTEDLFYCENGSYITNCTFSGHLAPSYTCSFPKTRIKDTITKTNCSGAKGSYKITLPNTYGLKERMYVKGEGVATSAIIQSIQDKTITLSTANEKNIVAETLTFDYIVGTAGVITRSPYVQNCTSLTTTGCGLLVDGNLASGTASFVLDSYTQYNQGGDGIVIVNGGYTQLVSIFEICCNRAVYLTAGSTCSITNSNTDFGNFGLVADGVGPLQYTCKVDGTQGPGAEFNLKDLPREPYVGQGITIGNNGNPYFFIREINIVNGGSGYQSPPSVEIDDPTGPSGIPAQAIANVQNGVVTSITLVSSGSQFISAPIITLVGGNPDEVATVEPEMYPQYYSILTSTDPVDGKVTITTDEVIPFDLNDNDEVYFFQLTKIIANSHCMEYVGAGTKIQEAIPARGGVPIQAREVVELNGGKVAFTSTDHLGNFRIGQGLQINQNTGTLSGDSFQRSLFVTVTPFILALS